MSLYENCLGFFAELAGNGVTDVVVSPGSRSTPLAISARFTPGIDLHVQIDERAAGFYALGLAKASRCPVALVCTSGSAAANYLPAVVEADLSGVPLILLTADRPPELRRWGAGQAIDQVGLFGSHVRSFVELPCGRDASEDFFRRAAARSVLDAVRAWPGPVHRNMPFREPLEPPDVLPPAPASTVRVSPAVANPDRDELTAMVQDLESVERGVILVGPTDLDATAVAELQAVAAGLGWPIVADPASQLRVPSAVATIVAHGDLLLRGERFADAHAPDAVLRIGASPTSKATKLWLEARPPKQLILMTEPRRWEEASFTATDIVEADTARSIAAMAAVVGPPKSSSWAQSWADAEAAAAALVAELDHGPLTELAVAGAVAGAEPLPTVVASSMPIRDLDTVMPAGPDRRVLANRGANGIDGLVATASGVSSVLGRTLLLIGDVALLHDVGSVLEAGRNGRPLTLVVIDNDGGGIFSMLPVASHGDAVDFETLFTTPHGARLDAVRAFPGINVSQPDSISELRAALATAMEGVHLVHVAVGRDESIQQRRELVARVEAAVSK